DQLAQIECLQLLVAEGATLPAFHHFGEVAVAAKEKVDRHADGEWFLLTFAEVGELLAQLPGDADLVTGVAIANTVLGAQVNDLIAARDVIADRGELAIQALLSVFDI